MFTPVQRQSAMASSAASPVRSLRSQRTGPNPKISATWFIIAESDSAKMSRKTMPATTTEVSAGTNIEALKNALMRALPMAELTSADPEHGEGHQERQDEEVGREPLRVQELFHGGLVLLDQSHGATSARPDRAVDRGVS